MIQIIVASASLVQDQDMRKHAFALAMTLLVIALIAVVAFMAINVANLDSRSVTQEVQGARALYAARAGISAAMANLTGLRNPSWGNPEAMVVLQPNKLAFRVSVVPHPNNTAPPQRSQLAWMVTSTGLVGPPPYAAQRTLQAYIQQEPFSRYAYFTSQEIGRDANGNPVVIRFVDHDQITGPAHTNGYFTFAGHPKFSETVRSANMGPDPQNPTVGKDPYYTPAVLGPNPQPARYTSPRNGTTTNPALFYHCENDGSNQANGPVALDGSTQFSMAGGQPYIPLPVDNGAILSSARESGLVLGIPAPTNPGPLHYLRPENASANYAIVYNENNGQVTGYTRNGVAISAANAPPVFQLRFTTGGAQVYRWNPSTNSYRPWDHASGDYASQPTVLDTTSQTIYVEGTCMLQGTMRGRTTVGIQYDAHLTDNLVYDERATDVLGVVANQSIILQSRTNVRRDRTVHATLMALKGSFTVNNYDQGSDRGVLHLFGGIIQRTRGAVGTGTATQVSTGYSKDYIFDEKLVFRPPLNFPTTPNVYIVSLRDMGATGSR